MIRCVFFVSSIQNTATSGCCAFFFVVLAFILALFGPFAQLHNPAGTMLTTQLDMRLPRYGIIHACVACGHIISYHIISYHIISYHIISYIRNISQNIYIYVKSYFSRIMILLTFSSLFKHIMS